MAEALDEAGLNLLFRNARTHTAWLDEPVTDETLNSVYDHLRWGPTSANCSPLRIIFVKSAKAKERLRPHLSAGNVDKTMAAPATAILAQDMAFYNQLPRLFPHRDVRSDFVGKDDHIRQTAFRNSSLQGGYFILAARALGLDCGPMSGFNSQTLDTEFFPNQPFESNFLCNLGYGDRDKLHPRGPRLEFDEACSIA